LRTEKYLRPAALHSQIPAPSARGRAEPASCGLAGAPVAGAKPPRWQGRSRKGRPPPLAGRRGPGARAQPAQPRRDAESQLQAGRQGQRASRRRLEGRRSPRLPVRRSPAARVVAGRSQMARPRAASQVRREEKGPRGGGSQARCVLVCWAGGLMGQKYRGHT
jgi:hypothetical protein